MRGAVTDEVCCISSERDRFVAAEGGRQGNGKGREGWMGVSENGTRKPLLLGKSTYLAGEERRERE